MYGNQGVRRYRETDLGTMTRERMVVLLYEKTIADLEEAVRCLETGDRCGFTRKVNHSQRIVADGVVEDISYAAQGCSISVASTSILAEEVTGRPVPEALDTYAAMKAMLTSRGHVPGDEDVIGDGVAL